MHILARLGVRLENSQKWGFMVHHNSKSSLVVKVKPKQHLDPKLMEFKKSIYSKSNESFSWGDAIIRYQGMLCVPDVDDLRRPILEEAHGSRYYIHSGATKMYCDLQEMYC